MNLEPQIYKNQSLKLNPRKLIEDIINRYIDTENTVEW